MTTHALALQLVVTALGTATCWLGWWCGARLPAVPAVCILLWGTLLALAVVTVLCGVAGCQTEGMWQLRWWPRAFWWHLWTPTWHQGRGPYLSIGLWVVAVYRGYQVTSHTFAFELTTWVLCIAMCSMGYFLGTQRVPLPLATVVFLAALLGLGAVSVLFAVAQC